VNDATHVSGDVRAVVLVEGLSDRVAVEVSDGEVDRRDLLFHCLVPAARWWDDIVFT
jgi:hypothetical protein